MSRAAEINRPAGKMRRYTRRWAYPHTAQYYGNIKADAYYSPQANKWGYWGGDDFHVGHARISDWYSSCGAWDQALWISSVCGMGPTSFRAVLNLIPSPYGILTNPYWHRGTGVGLASQGLSDAPGNNGVFLTYRQWMLGDFTAELSYEIDSGEDNPPYSDCYGGSGIFLTPWDPYHYTRSGDTAVAIVRGGWGGSYATSFVQRTSGDEYTRIAYQSASYGAGGHLKITRTGDTFYALGSSWSLPSHDVMPGCYAQLTGWMQRDEGSWNELNSSMSAFDFRITGPSVGYMSVH